MLVKTGCRLLEPIMSLDIILPAERSSQVLADLARRRPQSLEVTARGDNKVKIMNVLKNSTKTEHQTINPICF